MECPDPEELARYADGLVTGELRDRIAAHVDGCPSCREVLVTLIRSSAPDAPAIVGPVPEGEQPKRGDVIGRYVVLDARGAGGMGLVVSAHDNQLDRKVALKLVRPDLEQKGGAEHTRARLLREAQLMARVRHPNVVTVYDVGTLGERIFIAMELVDGVTLRTWLKERPRSVDEILAVFTQAGRGLAAAHAAGVVHRDFKPDNVLVDAQGAAHVMDFGIASSQAHPEVSGEGVTGTPAYMSAEQLTGAAIDARTDQFAFCVALYEALAGRRPFEGLQRAAPAPIGRKVPARVEAALRRGLELQPAARFPDMPSLLEPLQPRSRRGLWLGLAASLAAVAAAGGTFALTRPQSDCEAAPARLQGVWDAERRAQVRTAFEATSASFATTAFESAAAALDRRADEWQRAFRASCDQPATDEVRSRQRVCLDARLAELRALTELFARADASVVEHAALAAQRVRGPQGCLEGEALATLPLPDDPSRRAAIAQVRLKLAQSDAEHQAGHLQKAIDAARAAIELAKRTKYPPVEAEAWLQLVEPLRDDGQYDEARRALEDAATAAEAGRHFEALLLVSVKHVRVVDATHTETADIHIKRAEAALQQTPRPDVQAQLDSVVAQLRLAQRRTSEAVARSASARRYYETVGREAEALGERHITALAQRARGDPAEAARELLAVLGDYERVLGPSHPLTLHVRVHIAEAKLDLGEAQDVLDRLADPIFDGPDRLTPSWQTMRAILQGDAHRMLGSWDAALEAHRRAAGASATGGARNTGAARLHLAATLRELERLDEAEPVVKAAIEQIEKTSSATSLAPHVAQLELAELSLARGQPAAAVELAEASLKRLSAVVEDAAAPERVHALLVASSAAAAVKDGARARLLADEALQLAPEGSVLAARARLRAGSLAEGFEVLSAAGVFPLEQLLAADVVGCERLSRLEALRLPPGAAKVLVKRCPK